MWQWIGKTSSWVRLVAFLGLLVVVWLPQLALLLALLGWRGGPLNNVQNITGAVTLYGNLIAMLYIFARWVDLQPFQSYGFRWDRSDWLGLGLGLGLVLGGMVLLFEGQAALGWVQLDFMQPVNWGVVILTGFGVAGAFAVIEELFFRGFLINLWARDYGLNAAVGISGAVFAVSHFLKPWEAIIASWPQFPALLIVGLLLGLTRRWAGDRLGMGMGLHGGWIWMVYVLNSGGVLRYTDQVDPVWTGLGGNPLASILGLSFFALMSGVVWTITRLIEWKN